MSRFLDKIIYINLQHRTDRKEELENELNSLGLTYERFNAIYTPEFGAVGCAYSHLEVLKLAKSRGYKNILVFEDDFTFCVSKEVFESSLENLFTNIPDFDVCMLGYNLQEKGTVLDDNPVLMKVCNAQTMSAYIVNESMYDKLIKLYEWANPLLQKTGQHWIYACDQSWKLLQPESKWFCFTQRIGVQRPSYSDCGQQFIDNKC